MLPPWGTGTSKTHFFFSAEKETVFACQRKRGVVGTSCASLASPFGERSSAPLCLLSPADPLRWAPPGAPYNYRDASANGAAARCFTQRTSTSPGHGHPWEEQGKVVVLSPRRLVCGPCAAWVRDAPEWKAVRSYPSKMLCCWAQGSTFAAAQPPPLRRRRDNVSRRR